MKIIFIAPYSEKLMETVLDCARVELEDIEVVGSKEEIAKYLSKKELEKLVIKDIILEKDIVDYVIEIKNSKNILVFGEIAQYNKRKILKELDNSIDYYFIDIFDIPNLKNYIYVPSLKVMNTYVYEEKRKMIKTGFEFMNKLGIKKSNLRYIDFNITEAEMLEANVLNLLFKEENIKINALNPITLSNLFDLKNKENIYQCNLNMIIFNSYKFSRMFREFMYYFMCLKVGCIGICSENYFIDTREITDPNQIIFSLLIIKKVIKNYKNLIGNN